MKRYFIDTNIFLRAIVEDHAIQSKKSQDFLSSLATSRDSYFTTIWVIVEVLWTLNSFYKFPRSKTIEVVESIAAMDIDIIERSLVIDALSYYKKQKVDFIDCINFAISKKENATGIISFDTDFSKLGGTRIEPPSK